MREVRVGKTEETLVKEKEDGEGVMREQELKGESVEVEEEDEEQEKEGAMRRSRAPQPLHFKPDHQTAATSKGDASPPHCLT